MGYREEEKGKATIHQATALWFAICFMICIHNQMQALMSVCLSFKSRGPPKC